MDLKTSLAAHAYQQARPAAAARAASTLTGAETGLAGRLAEDFASVLARTEDLSAKAMTGGADPHSLVMALAESQFAVEAAVTVRDRVVEAYQEILRMPV
jgi:flagellar hook-basal body complex protein FliE